MCLLLVCQCGVNSPRVFEPLAETVRTLGTLDRVVLWALEMDECLGCFLDRLRFRELLAREFLGRHQFDLDELQLDYEIVPVTAGRRGVLLQTMETIRVPLCDAPRSTTIANFKRIEAPAAFGFKVTDDTRSLDRSSASRKKEFVSSFDCVRDDLHGTGDAK